MRTMLRHISAWEGAKLGFFLFITLGTLIIVTFTPTLFPSALISTLLFFIFSPLIDALERKGISRTQGILAVFTICGVLIAMGASAIFPRISREMEAIQQGSSRYSGEISEKLKLEEKRILDDYPLFRRANLSEKALGWVEKSAQKFWNLAPDLASHLLVALFLVPFLTFIILKDAHEIRRSLLMLVPNRYFETVYSLTSRILQEMGGYVSARILEAFLVASVVAVGCIAFKIPYAFLLAVFAGATNPIPYLGPLLGAIPGIALAILEPTVPRQLFWILAVYFVANIIDMVVIFPLLVAKIVDLHPVAVVIAVILGGQFFGVAGMLLAVPVTSIFKILIQEVYSRIYPQSPSRE
ncbi:MAG: AI-2E family transporter [Bdellovibrionota bacterium]